MCVMQMLLEINDLHEEESAVQYVTIILFRIGFAS